ncbi:MAG: ion transporter [Coleofasciculaceae cyanobacterium]
MKYKNKQRVFELLEKTEHDDAFGKAFDVFILVVIFLSLVAVCLETVESFYSQYQYLLNVFDAFSVLVFTTEYILRIWACVISPKFRHPVWGRIRYLFTPLAIIDLLAVLPFYLPLLLPDLRFVLSLRMLRLFRILKFSRYSDSLKTLIRVVHAQQEELVVSFSVLSILLLFASSLIYLAEHDAQPEVFTSIPVSMWWGVITLTTVGYGDVYPITAFGKLLGAILAILGIGLFALPAGILASGFSEELQAKRLRNQPKLGEMCPHCGQEIEKTATAITHKSRRQG